MQKHIVIVDDEEDILMLICKILSDEEYIIHTAHDAVALSELLKTIRPDLIILDVMMPGLDGFELCAQLKTNPQTHTIPVVMLTVMDRPSDVQRGLTLGASAYLTKPFDPDDLGHEIHNLLHPDSEDPQK